MHIFGLFRGENIIKVNLKWLIIVKPLTFHTFLAFSRQKSINISRLAQFFPIFSDFCAILTLRAFFSVPDCADGKCIFFYNFCPIELIFGLNERYWIGATLQWIRFVIQALVFQKKWLKVKISAFFLIFYKIGHFRTLKLEKNFFEDLNQKCNPLRFKISWGSLV